MMETQSVAGVACTDLHQAMSRIDGAALARLSRPSLKRTRCLFLAQGVRY
ncbi:hypothetical protein ECZU29_32170 [Escherichia coli]|nr:hypothetical protein ECZU29_32170 [Escherichia coli]